MGSQDPRHYGVGLCTILRDNRDGSYQVQPDTSDRPIDSAWPLHGGALGIGTSNVPYCHPNGDPNFTQLLTVGHGFGMKDPTIEADWPTRGYDGSRSNSANTSPGPGVQAVPGPPVMERDENIDYDIDPYYPVGFAVSEGILFREDSSGRAVAIDLSTGGVIMDGAPPEEGEPARLSFGPGPTGIAWAGYYYGSASQDGDDVRVRKIDPTKYARSVGAGVYSDPVVWNADTDCPIRFPTFIALDTTLNVLVLAAELATGPGGAFEPWVVGLRLLDGDMLWAVFDLRHGSSLLSQQPNIQQVLVNVETGKTHVQLSTTLAPYGGVSVQWAIIDTALGFLEQNYMVRQITDLSGRPLLANVSWHGTAVLSQNGITCPYIYELDTYATDPVWGPSPPMAEKEEYYAAVRDGLPLFDRLYLTTTYNTDYPPPVPYPDPDIEWSGVVRPSLLGCSPNGELMFVGVTLEPMEDPPLACVAMMDQLLVDAVANTPPGEPAASAGIGYPVGFVDNNEQQCALIHWGWWLSILIEDGTHSAYFPEAPPVESEDIIMAFQHDMIVLGSYAYTLASVRQEDDTYRLILMRVK
jgi:hypothetical protein